MKQLPVIFLVAAILIGCNSSDKPAAQTPVEEVKPLSVSKNSSAFNISFENMLNSYLALKDALVEYDTAKANAASRQLTVLADSLKTGDIKGDSTGTIISTAKNYAGTIAGSAKALIGEQDLVKKKKEFQMISDALYDLVRIVKYDGQKLYHQHCPMAFGEEEAYWISTTNEIVNPYLGKKHSKYKDAMLHCGDVTDSLDFRK